MESDCFDKMPTQVIDPEPEENGYVSGSQNDGDMQDNAIDDSGYISSDSSVYDIDSDDENYNNGLGKSEDQDLDNIIKK